MLLLKIIFPMEPKSFLLLEPNFCTLLPTQILNHKGLVLIRFFDQFKSSSSEHSMVASDLNTGSWRVEYSDGDIRAGRAAAEIMEAPAISSLERPPSPLPPHLELLWMFLHFYTRPSEHSNIHNNNLNHF